MSGPSAELSVRHPRIWLLPAVLTSLGLLYLLAPAVETASALENRNLAAWPELSWKGLRDGSYTRQIDDYVADHFPGRDRFVAAAFWLRSHRGVQDDGPVFHVVGKGTAVEFEKAEDWADVRPEDDEIDNEDNVDERPATVTATAQGTPTAADDLALADDAELPVEASAADSPRAVSATHPPHHKLLAAVAPQVAPLPNAASPAAPAKTGKSGGKVSSKDGILTYQGRAIQVFGGSLGAARAAAKMINLYRSTLPPEVKVYALVVPTAVSFHLPERWVGTTAHEKRNTDVLYGALDSGVRAVDAHGEMRKHAGEYMFFRTDHHWTGRGAYYAYRALLASAGLPDVPLEGLTRKVRKGFLGTLFAYTQEPGLKDTPDEVEYWLPKTTYKAVRYDRINPQKPVPATFLYERANSYGVFLGGDVPLLVADTSLKNGRRVLLTKNSYGNALAPFLLNSFERVVVVDYRYFCGSVAELVRNFRLTDVVLLNTSFSANTGYHRRRQQAVLTGDDAKKCTPAGDKTP